MSTHVPLNDPRKIRKWLREVAHSGGRIDGNKSGDLNINHPALLLSNITRLSDANGFSGEDAMTVLAYRALLELEATLDQLLINIPQTIKITT